MSIPVTEQIMALGRCLDAAEQHIPRKRPARPGAVPTVHPMSREVIDDLVAAAPLVRELQAIVERPVASLARCDVDFAIALNDWTRADGPSAARALAEPPVVSVATFPGVRPGKESSR